MEKNKTYAIFVSLILTFLFFDGVSVSLAHHGRQHSDRDQEPMHFVLVHGACLGAWS